MVHHLHKFRQTKRELRYQTLDASPNGSASSNHTLSQYLDVVPEYLCADFDDLDFRNPCAREVIDRQISIPKDLSTTCNDPPLSKRCVESNN